MSWSNKEVKTFISVLREANILQETDGAIRNKAAFEKMTRCLQEAGYDLVPSYTTFMRSMLMSSIMSGFQTQRRLL